MRMHSPAHPGSILREVMGEKVTVSALAKHLGMSRANLSNIIHGKLDISAAVAVKLWQAFPNWEPEFWQGLQAQYDLAKILRQKRKTIEPFFPVVKTKAKKAA